MSKLGIPKKMLLQIGNSKIFVSAALKSDSCNFFYWLIEGNISDIDKVKLKVNNILKPILAEYI